jgi:hypothetical protein
MIGSYVVYNTLKREPNMDEICKIAMHDKEIKKLTGDSLESCRLMYNSDMMLGTTSFRDKCNDCYKWARGHTRGD